MADAETNDILTLTTEIVSSYVGSASHMNAADIPDLIRSVRAALSEDAAPVAAAAPEMAKATKSQINKSMQPHALTSFIDGKPYKTLKRHLTRHGHTMESYRAAYGLPNDYPSVAPDYSAARSAMAKTIGLGAKGRGRAAEPVPAKAAPKKKAPKEAAPASSAE